MFGTLTGFLKNTVQAIVQSGATVDGYAVTACWSFRKLVAQYKGPAITLSDGTTSVDIRFTANNEIDFDAAAKAIAAGQNQLARLYDQGVYKLHLYQANPALRATLVIDATPGHLPAITFAGSAAAYYDAPAHSAINNLFDASGNGGYLLLGANLAGTGGNGAVLSKGPTKLALTSGGSTFTQGYSTTSGVFNAASTLGWTTYEVIYGNGGTGDVPLIAANKTSLATVGTAPAGSRLDDSAYPLRLGADVNGNAGASFTFTELLLVKGAASSAAKSTLTRALRGRFSDRFILEKLAITPPVLNNPTVYTISNDPNTAGNILVTKTLNGVVSSISYASTAVITLTAAFWQNALEDVAVYCSSVINLAALQLKNGNNWIMYGGHYVGTVAAANPDGSLNSQGIKAIIRCIGSKGLFHEEGLYVDTNALLGLDSFDVGDNGTNSSTQTSAAITSASIGNAQTFTFPAIAAASLAAYPTNPTAVFVYYGADKTGTGGKSLTGTAVLGTDYTLSFSGGTPTTPVITPLQPLLDKINAVIAQDGTQPNTLQVVLQYLQSGNFQHGYCYHTGMYNTSAIKIHADGWQLYGDVGTVSFDHFTLKTTYQGFFTDPQHLVTSYSFRSCNVDYIDPNNATGYALYIHNSYTLAQHAGGQVDVPYAFNDFYVGPRYKFVSSQGVVSTPAIPGDPDGSFWATYTLYPKYNLVDSATGILFGCTVAGDGQSATWPAYAITGQVKRGPGPRGDFARAADGVGANWASVAPGYLSTVIDYTAYPALLTAPVMLTNGEAGNPIACTTGTWSNNPTSFICQYVYNGSPVGSPITVAPGVAVPYTGTAPAAGDTLYLKVSAQNVVDNSASVSNTVTFFTATQYANSVQQISVTIAAGALSAQVNINPVGPRAYFVREGFTQTDTGAGDGPVEFAYPVFSDARTVTVARYATAAYPVTLNFSIVDASAKLVDSVQFGTVTMNGVTSSNAALATAVDLSRSVVMLTGQQATVYGSISKAAGAVALTGASQVTGYVGVAPTGSSATCAFQVIQFKAGVVNSIQSFGTATTASGATDTTTITGVAPANAVLLHNGTITTTTTVAAFRAAFKLASATTFTATRTSTSGVSRTHYVTILEFVAGVLASMQRGTVAVASATSATGSVSAVTPARAVLSQTGFSTTAANADETYAALALTTGTTVTGSKATAGSTTSTPGYELYEMN